MRFILFCLAAVAYGEIEDLSLSAESDFVEVEGNIQGIVLVNSESDLLSEEELQSMDEQNERQVDFSASLRQELELLYRGKPWNEETVEEIKAKIHEYYQSQERSSVIVTIPEQSKRSGMLQIVIEESAVAVEEEGVAEEQENAIAVTEPETDEAIVMAEEPVAEEQESVVAVAEPEVSEAIVMAEEPVAEEQESVVAVAEPEVSEAIVMAEEPVAEEQESVVAVAEPEVSEEIVVAEEPVAEEQESVVAVAEPEASEEIVVAEEPVAEEQESVVAVAEPEVSEAIAIAEEPVAAAEPEGEKEEAIQGIIFVRNQSCLFTEEELQSLGQRDENPVDPSDFSTALRQELEFLYRGKPWNEETVEKIKAKIYGYYQTPAYSSVVVRIPEQNKRSGMMQIVIEEGAICLEDGQFPEEIRGIVLLSSKKELLSEDRLESIRGLDAEWVDLPGYSSLLEQQLQPLYIGQPWNDETVEQIENKIYEYYQSKERPFIIVTVPSQNKASRVLQLVIEESKLGKIEVVGNKWTPTSRYLQYFHTQAGEPISLRRVSKDINFINRNPFRRVNLIYSPGAEENRTDLTLQVSDRRPYRFYTGFENNGVPTTGRQRIFAGFSWDQLFNLDHSFFYQYTTNYNAQRFHANTFQYMAMLPSETILNLYGGYSVVRAKIPSPSQKNKGNNIQGSARYILPFLPMKQFMQELTVGFDVKNTNNNMEFVDMSPTFGQTVNLTQFMIGYQCKWEKDSLLAECGADLFFSPMEWIPNQTSDDFASLRPGAENRWIYATFFGKVLYSLGRSFTYSFFARGQMTPQILLPSEQLGLGGYDSIRGYDDRQYNADTGIWVNNEIQSPSFSIFRSRQPNADKMYFLLFLDAGIGVDNKSIFGVKPWNGLVGLGPGVRYSFGSYLTARLDYGFKLHRQADFSGGNGMIHFSLIGSY